MNLWKPMCMHLTVIDQKKVRDIQNCTTLFVYLICVDLLNPIQYNYFF